MPAVPESATPAAARGAVRLELAAVIVVLLTLAAAGAAAFVSSDDDTAGSGKPSKAMVACLPNANRLGPAIDLGVDPSTGDPSAPLLSTTSARLLVGLAYQAGATIISTTADWSVMQPTKGVPIDFTGLGRVVQAAQESGVDVRIQLVGTPSWAQDHPSGSHYQPPRSVAELNLWRGFVRAVVTKYSGLGVSYFEVWNEPDEKAFWSTGPDPAAFVRLLAVSDTAIHDVNSALQVISGGLAGNDVGFLRQMYTAIAEQRLPSPPFDLLGVHPFAGDQPPGSVDKARDVDRRPFGEFDENYTGFSKLHAVMAAHGDGDLPLYIGAFGYSTQAHDGVGAVSDDVRAGYLIDAFRAATCAPYVAALSWYALHPSSSVPASWALVDENLQPNATYKALVRWDQLVGGAAGP